MMDGVPTGKRHREPEDRIKKQVNSRKLSVFAFGIADAAPAESMSNHPQ